MPITRNHLTSPARHVWGGIGATLILALPALWPLLRPGFFASDDGSFHVYRVAALANAWLQGVLHPRLFPEFGFGYGQSVLNFYAPLSYWPGALLATLGVAPPVAAELTFALGFMLAALAAYGFARYLWGPIGGVLAAVAYTYFPYHLADAYQRGALPEHFAFTWLPLILWATTAAFREDDARGPWLWNALVFTGLIYTHNLTALLVAGAWVSYVLIAAMWMRRPRRLLGAAGSLALALGLSAPLWLPFFAERQYVGLALDASTAYREHLATLASVVLGAPFHRYRFMTGASHPLSWLTVILCLVLLSLLVWRLARRETIVAWPVAGFGAALVVASAFMVTQSALPVWRAFERVLMQLQYPWRFLILTAVGVMACAGALPTLLFGRDAVAGLRGPAQAVKIVCLSALGLALVLQPLPYLPAEPLLIFADEAWSPDRMWREDSEAGQVGATWTGEFLPLTVQEQRWALGRSREDAQDGAMLTSRPVVQVTRMSYDRLSLAVETVAPLTVRLHQFHLPTWQATVNSARVPTYPTGELGLVSVDLPRGANHVAFRFGPTPAWIAGGLVALFATALWTLVAWRSVSSSKWLRKAAVALVAFAAVLGLNSLGIAQRSWAPKSVQSALGDVALLIGYDAVPARANDALDVTLYWFALRDNGINYKTFVHMLGSDGQVIAQHDGDPGGGFTPTTRWRTGEIIIDTHRLSLPADLASGSYRLKAGMYQLEPLSNLLPDPATPDGRVDMGEVILE